MARKKANAYLYAFLFLIWMIINGLIHIRLRILQHQLLIACCVTILNAGHCFINFSSIYHHPFAPEKYRGLNINEQLSPTFFLSNIIRNISLHLGTPSLGLNQKIAKSIHSIHDTMGLDIVDQRITYGTMQFSMFFSNNEDYPVLRHLSRNSALLHSSNGLDEPI